MVKPTFLSFFYLSSFLVVVFDLFLPSVFFLWKWGGKIYVQIAKHPMTWSIMKWMWPKKKNIYIYIYIYNKSRYEQCFEFCSVLVGTDEKYCIGIQTKIILHWIKFCPIPSCFGCTFWAFLFPLKVKPLP